MTKWTKGFSATGVIGYNVVQRLQEQFDRRRLPLKCRAILNDTTGTMMAKAIEAPNTKIGVIVGTGTNACYVEEMRNIWKLRPSPDDTRKMVINCELGNFYTESLRRTDMDITMDKNGVVENIGRQQFEKMIAGELC